MPWAYRFDERALRELKKLDRQGQIEIIAYLDERIAGTGDPTRFGKPLRKDLKGLWRYRVGAYRIICDLRRGDLVVLVIRVGHRSRVYE
jgi:mRNA interferase RelE/StbE